MYISQLDPPPENSVPFVELPLSEIPSSSGCYAIANVNEEILYIGQSKDLHRRLHEHLGDRRMTESTPLGQAFYIAFLRYQESLLDQLEDLWIKEYVLQHGAYPCLNQIAPPAP